MEKLENYRVFLTLKSVLGKKEMVFNGLIGCSLTSELQQD